MKKVIAVLGIMSLAGCGRITQRVECNSNGYEVTTYARRTFGVGFVYFSYKWDIPENEIDSVIKAEYNKAVIGKEKAMKYQ